jgi:hypothetical protein
VAGVSTRCRPIEAIVWPRLLGVRISATTDTSAFAGGADYVLQIPSGAEA